MDETAINCVLLRTSWMEYCLGQYKNVSEKKHLNDSLIIIKDYND